MAYQIEWFVDQRIMKVDLVGDMEIEEVKRMQDEIFEEFDKGIAPIHLIVDISNVETYPSAISLTKFAGARRHPSVDWTMVVGTNSLAVFIAGTFLKLIGVRYRMFAKFDDAQEFLRKQDVTVPM